MKTNLKNTLTALFIALLLLLALAMGGAGLAPAAHAAGVSAFERRNALEDLRETTLDGKPFDLNDYKFTKERRLSVVVFAEFGFSFYANRQSDYGLYVYIYNPQNLIFDLNSISNKVQLSAGSVDDYKKYTLSYLNSYDNRLFKFKVVMNADERADVLGKLNASERVYKVSGVELIEKQADNAADYSVGLTYKYSGYAQGYGEDSNAQSTLKHVADKLDVVELDVHHTYYRTNTSSKGFGWQNQIDSVYFSLPNEFFETYGKLQRIKAEWYEYKTRDIIVTSNNDFYQSAREYIGVDIPFEEAPFTDEQVLDKSIYGALGDQEDMHQLGTGLAFAEWGWNLGRGFRPKQRADALYYLFKTDGDIYDFDPYADITSNGGIESNALYDYIKSYNKTFKNGRLPIKHGTVSADLFEEDIPEERKKENEAGKIQMGYSYYDFDADTDMQAVVSWNDTNPTFWQNMQQWGFWNALFGNVPTEAGFTFSPIRVLKDNDLTGTNEQISKEFVVNLQDVNLLREFQTAAAKEDKSVILFRFAASDYYANGVDIIPTDKPFFDPNFNFGNIGGEAYRAHESVFLDFDIIQLTFMKPDTITIIPVVASPIDIIDDVTPPVNPIATPSDFWKWGLLIIAALAVVYVFYRFIYAKIIKKGV